jgi:hypothetical protein
MYSRLIRQLRRGRMLRMKTFYATFVLCWSACAYGHDVLPEKYVGVWATDESVLEGETLWGGQALYLDADGEGSIVGAPLPVNKCGDRYCAPVIGFKVHASVADEGRTLVADITDYGAPKQEIRFSYDEESHSLLVQSGHDRGKRFTRRFSKISSSLRAMLHEKL